MGGGVCIKWGPSKCVFTGKVPFIERCSFLKVIKKSILEKKLSSATSNTTIVIFLKTPQQNNLSPSRAGERGASHFNSWNIWQFPQTVIVSHCEITQNHYWKGNITPTVQARRKHSHKHICTWKAVFKMLEFSLRTELLLGTVKASCAFSSKRVSKVCRPKRTKKDGSYINKASLLNFFNISLAWRARRIFK